MTLYEIDRSIIDLVNDDGEIADFEIFDKLQMERTEKIENIACYIKNLRAQSEAIKSEINALTERKRAAENRAESLKNYLAYALCGSPFESAKVKVSYRKSETIECDAEFIKYAEANNKSLLRYKAPEADKKRLKELITAGGKVPHCSLVEHSNMIIK